MSKRFFLLAIGIVVVCITIGLLIYLFIRPTPAVKVELVMWTVFDQRNIHDDLILEFRKKFPATYISVETKSFQNYEKELIDAMAAGQGPDIMMIHHTWLPKFKDKIISMVDELPQDSPLPQGLATLRNYQDSYVDVVQADFVDEGRVWAIPMYVDTLGLYYNKDLFHTAGIAEAPETWDEFMDDVELLREKNVQDDIIKAGAAIGTAENVNRSTDILGLLMLQTGANMVSDDRTKATFDDSVGGDRDIINPGQEALRFYTDFANPLMSSYTWNQRMDYSIDMFYEGTVAMMMNYSYHIPTIRSKAPYLNFEVAKMPQIKEAEFDVNYANYMGLAITKKCMNSENAIKCYRAWDYLLWFSQKEITQKYLEAARRPTPRKDLIEWQKTDVDLGVFAEQALSARSWYQVDSLSIESIFKDMIELVVEGQMSIPDAVSRAAAQVTVLMQ